MKKNIDRLTIVLFAQMLGGLFIANLFRPIRSFSENENRNLAQLPLFSIERLFNHEFTNDFESFITDQFVGRDRWVEVKTFAERLLGKVENNGVYFGKDNTLIERIATVDEALVERNVNYVNKFADSLPKNVQVDMMLIPGSAAINTQLLPWVSDDIDQLAWIDKIGEQMSDRIQFINVNQAMLDHREEGLYFRTDHHYNAKGAGVVYQQYASALGFPASAYEYTVVSESFLGTLASQSGAYSIKPDEILKIACDEAISVYYPDQDLQDNNVYAEANLVIKDKYTYYLNGNHSHVQITTNEKDK